MFENSSRDSDEGGDNVSSEGEGSVIISPVYSQHTHRHTRATAVLNHVDGEPPPLCFQQVKEEKGIEMPVKGGGRVASYQRETEHVGVSDTDYRP